MNAEQQAVNETKTVRVRIAVAVDSEGRWYACSWSNDDAGDAMDIACDNVGEGAARYWLSTELALPVATDDTVTNIQVEAA